MKRLEDYIALIDKSENSDGAFDTFSEIIKDFGYEGVIYRLATDHPSVGLKEGQGLVASYPDEWTEYYVANDCFGVDPIYQRIINSGVPFFWSDIKKQSKTSGQNDLLMNLAREAGLKNGVGMALHGSIGEMAAMGLANDIENHEDDYDNLAKIHFLATYFHETYKQHAKKSDPIKLSKKEKELLEWASEGKTDAEIALIMHISMPTVRYHWNNIFEKLNANGRVYAVTKALMLQLINPYSLIKNYQKR